MLAGNLQGELAAVDDDLLDRVVELQAAAVEGCTEGIGEVVEIAAVRPRRGPRANHLRKQAAVTAGVSGAANAEHPAANLDNLGRTLGGRQCGVVRGLVNIALGVASQ